MQELLTLPEHELINPTTEVIWGESNRVQLKRT